MVAKEWEFAKIAEKNYQKVQEKALQAEEDVKRKERSALKLKGIIIGCDILFQLYLFYTVYKYWKGC